MSSRKPKKSYHYRLSSMVQILLSLARSLFTLVRQSLRFGQRVSRLVKRPGVHRRRKLIVSSTNQQHQRQSPASRVPKLKLGRGLRLLLCWLLGFLLTFNNFWLFPQAWDLSSLFGQPVQAQVAPPVPPLFETPATETIPAGSYIVDMGQPTQTVANGLKPYGLLYELVAKFSIPVKWVINPNKGRDGIDFSAGGKSYRGSAFIITAEYVSEALTTINNWKAQGVVVDGPTASDITVPVYQTLTSFPNAVLDFQNGSIAQGYYNNAGIPASTIGPYGSFTTYRFDYPSGLTNCDDLFVMPHADPVWSTHSNLIPFNQSQGFIWAACHAVSVLERVDDPGDADFLPDMNFLSHEPPAVRDSPSLKLFGKHAGPTAGPYEYYNTTQTILPYGNGNTNIWAYPIMQFLGNIDLATQNGSEQIYVPEATAQWRDTTAIATYDQDIIGEPDLNTNSQDKAVKMAFGAGFGNSNNGIVMYEAGHSHAKSTAPDNVAAQRAFLNWVLLSGIVRGINVDINVPEIVDAGDTVDIGFSISGGTGSNYSYRWFSSCGGTFGQETGAGLASGGYATTFTAPTTANQPCRLRLLVEDPCERRAFGSDPTVIAGKKVDIGVTKTDGLNDATQKIAPGATVTYTITVTNSINSPNTLNSLIVNDTIPPPLLNPTFTPSVGSYNSSTGAWTGLNFAPGNSITLTLQGTIDPNTSSTSMTNNVSVSPPSDFTDTNTSNNSASDTTNIAIPSADLAVTKNDGVSRVGQNSVITYVMTVTNNGPDPVSAIRVEDFIDAQDREGRDALEQLIWSTSKGTLNRQPTEFDNNNDAGSNLSPPLIWTVNLAVGESATLTLTGTVRVNEGKSPLINTVTMTPLKPNGTVLVDPNPNNNSATDTDTIVQEGTEVDLVVTKTHSPTTPNPAPGEAITYTVTVTNTRSGFAQNSTFTDSVPSAITNVTWTCSASATPAGTACGAASGSGNLINTTLSVPQNGVVTYTITGTISPTATGSLTNTAAAMPPAIDPTNINRTMRDRTPSNNTATDTFTLAPKADLGIVKTDGKTTAAPGSPISYSITVTNNGPSAVTGMTITDNVPAAILNPAFGVNRGTFTYNSSTGVGTWTNLNLLPTQNVVLTLTGTVDPNATGNLINTASVAVQTGVTDPVSTNNSSTDTNTIQTTADLAIVKTDGKTTAVPGQPIGYTLTVKNNGPSAVSGLTLTDNIPATILNPVLTGPDGSTLTQTSASTWQVTGISLPAGESVVFLLAGEIDPTATGTLINTATVAPPSGVVDPDTTTTGSQNSSTDTNTLSPRADLRVTKTDNQLYVNAGETLTYTIEVTNLGPSTISSLTLTDTPPSELNNTSFSPSVGSYNASTGEWTGLNLAEGNVVTLTLTGTVSNSFTSGTITNTATVSPPTGVSDLNPANDTDSDETTVPRPTGEVNLSINKTNNNTDPLVPGSDVTYDITVTNNGPGTIDSLTITDAVPADLFDTFFATPDGQYTVNGDDVEITLREPLTPGNSILLVLSGTLSTSPTTSPLTNTATVTPQPGFTDPDTTNNSSTDSDPIQGVASTAPNVILVKRITAINELTANPNDGRDLSVYIDTASPYDDNVITVAPSAGEQQDTDQWPTPSQFLLGEVAGGEVMPDDRIEYTIYYVSAGPGDAENVRVCDRVPNNQTFVADAFNDSIYSPAPGGIVNSDRGILIDIGGATFSYTNAGGDDTARFYPPGSQLPPLCGIGANNDGAIVANLGRLPFQEYGFIRFRAKVN